MASGGAINESLRRLGHAVFAIDPATGKSLLGSDGLFLTDAGNNVAPTRSAIGSLVKTIGSPGFQDIDVVFIGLHGGAGEDGRIQCLVELAGKKYTGSNMTASAIAMNKEVSKRLFKSVGVDTPQWKLFHLRGEVIDKSVTKQIVDSFEFPVIVKPNDAGSTIGLTKVERDDQLVPALEAARSESRDVLVESYINGREMTVAVIDGRPLPVVEIVPENGLYDYKAKYTRGSCEYIAPAKITPSQTKGLQEAAALVYDVIGASGLARADFLLAEDGTFYCLELNTLPGMTTLSLAPMAANADGMEFDDLITAILEMAVNR